MKYLMWFPVIGFIVGYRRMYWMTYNQQTLFVAYHGLWMLPLLCSLKIIL